MWNKKILTQTIKENLASGNFEAVENACRIAFEKSGLSDSDKNFLQKGFARIAEHYQKNVEYDSSVINYEYAKILNPANVTYLLNQTKIIEIIYNNTKDNLTNHDCQLLDLILFTLVEPYKSIEKFETALPAIELENELINKITSLLPHASNKEESPITFRLEKILNTIASLKFSHLSPDERVKEASKYLGKGLRRVLRKINQEKQNKPSK